MHTLRIDGDQLPALGLGTFQLEGDECHSTVRHALDVGYRHLDTAEMYGNEAQVGRAIADSGVSRDEIFLTTKVWWENLHPRDAARSLTESLRRLQTDYVDLWLIHWPNPSVPLGQTLEVLVEMKEAGKVHHVGVSNFPPPMVEEAASLAPIVCNQVEYHPFLSQAELLSTLRRHGLILTAYSPLAQGRAVSDRTLAEIGADHGKTGAQVALRWLLDQGSVAAIPRSSNPQHVAQNFDIFDFELSEEERRRIDGLACGRRIVDPPFAPDWEATPTARA